MSSLYHFISTHTAKPQRQQSREAFAVLMSKVYVKGFGQFPRRYMEYFVLNKKKRQDI